MEPEGQAGNSPEGVVPAPVQSQPVRYPSSGKGKGKKTMAMVLMGLSLALIGGGVLYFLGQKGKNEAEASPTPAYFIGGAETTAPEEALSPTASPKAFDRAKINIQILNGTGIPKEASYLQGILEELGYTEITASNSDKQDYTDCEVSYSSDLDEGAKDEITTELEKIYKNVKVGKTATTSKYDVVIITGLKKGATAKPQATATPKATGTAAPTTTATATPTVTPTATQ